MTVSYSEILFVGSIFLLPFFYETSHAFRYYLKLFLYYGIVMLIAVFLIPVFCLRAKDVRNLILASYFCRLVSPIIGLKWIIRGKEHLAKDESCIIVSNHQSSLDVLGMFELWPTMGKCTVIAKRGLLYAGTFGIAAWLSGLIFIPRVNSEQAKLLMNEAAQNIKSSKTKLWIFPEGTRRNTGQIHPFKKGAFHLAISTQLPVQPVVYSRYYFLDRKAKRLDQGKIIMTALPPIDTKGMTSENLNELMQKVRDLMTMTFHESNKELMDNPMVLSNAQ